MKKIKRVYALTGEDLTDWILEACENHAIEEPLDFIALLMAESGMQAINIYAERWGHSELNSQAKRAIQNNDLNLLQAIINAAWADISFGAGQQIVLFHYYGDRTKSVENCLAVRERVFSNPKENIDDAAKRFAAYLKSPTYDGSQPNALSAMIHYNAGSDRRGEPGWLKLWQGNIATYQRALKESRRYAWEEGEEVDKDRVARLMDVHYGIIQQLQPVIKEELYKQLFDVMVGVKEEAGLQPKN